MLGVVCGAGEGHAWGCAAPALVPRAEAGCGEWSPRRMRPAAGRGHHPLQCLGPSWPGSLLTHLRAESGLGTAAAAPMPGAGERLQGVRGSERKRPPTRGRGGGGESRRRAHEEGQQPGPPGEGGVPPPGVPGPLVSRPFAAETRPALARWPLAALPPSAKPVRERQRNSQFLRVRRRSGSPGWVRRRRVGFGRGRET